MRFTVFCFLLALQYDFGCGQNFTYLEFGKYSQNLTTSGNLITDMFLVSLEKPVSQMCTIRKIGDSETRDSNCCQFCAITVYPDDSICGAPKSNETLNRVKEAHISVSPVPAYLKYRWIDSYENNEPPSIFEGNDTEVNAIVSKKKFFNKPSNIVSYKEYEKQRLVKDSKYFNFLFFQIFGSILPALTTLFQNRQQSSNRMDLDRCYLNYKCAPDAMYFNSLNKLTSASSLAVVGILNLIVVFRKNIFRYQIPRFPTAHGIQQRDAPKVVCLLGLVAMGILWSITYGRLPIIVHIKRLFTCVSILKKKSKSIIFLRCLRFSMVMLFRMDVDLFKTAWCAEMAAIFYYLRVFSVRVRKCRKTILPEMNDTARLMIKISFSITATFATSFLCYKYYYERPSGLNVHQWIKRPLTKQEKILSEADIVYQPLKSKIVYIVVFILYTLLCSVTIFIFPNQTETQCCFRLGKGQVGIYLVYYIIQKIRFEWNTFSLRSVVSCSLYFFFSVECMNRYSATYRNTYAASLTPARSCELNSDCVLPGVDWKDLRHYNCALDCFLFIVLLYLWI
ncbi:Protein CBG15989 [Caenorhabditis briggsae]|uniref:Protein CBG15989 n=1 Tax=Caenorhabditis briggsae TaxID=6238 RepID=A8XNC3_CAEBR|nr:Protein CBG15989 [Caenorhabditis briggsae]CAP34354.2 Protein CBG15989 [Caenorhabditis briggsae]